MKFPCRTGASTTPCSCQPSTLPAIPPNFETESRLTLFVKPPNQFQIVNWEQGGPTNRVRDAKPKRRDLANRLYEKDGEGGALEQARLAAQPGQTKGLGHFSPTVSLPNKTTYQSHVIIAQLAWGVGDKTWPQGAEVLTSYLSQDCSRGKGTRTPCTRKEGERESR